MRRDLNSTEILQSRVGGKRVFNWLKTFLKRIVSWKELFVKFVCWKHYQFSSSSKAITPPWQQDQIRGQAVSESEKTAVPVCLDSESALNLFLAGNFIYDGGNEKRIIDCLENWVFVINVTKNADCLATEVCNWENMQPVWLSDLAYANTLKIWE